MTKTMTLPSESYDGWAHISLDASAWYVRFYLWLYDANPNSINTCKLFWAYVFAPFVLLIRVLFMPFVALLRWIDSKLPATPARPFDLEAYREERRLREEKASKREEKLDKWSSKFSAAYARIAPALKWVGIILGAAVGVAAAAALIWVCVAYPGKILEVLAVLAGMAIICLGIVVLLALLVEKTEFFGLLAKLGRSFHRHTCAKVEVSKQD